MSSLNFKFLVAPVLFLGLVLFSFLPVWGYLGFCPNFFIMVLYLWLIYRPDLIQLPSIVFVSLIQDGLYGYPLGVSLIEILPLFFFTQYFRRLILQKSFGSVFCGYVGYLIIFSLTRWGILSFFKGQWLPIFPLLQSVGFSLLVYPLVCHLSIALQKYIDRH